MLQLETVVKGWRVQFYAFNQGRGKPGQYQIVVLDPDMLPYFVTDLCGRKLAEKAFRRLSRQVILHTATA